MSVRRQRRVAAGLTPLLVSLFEAEPGAVNMRFHSYPPTDFAVAGVLLADRIPRPAQWLKRFLS
jgi:phenylpyruvate tautomerase PptA (4-oxalocrotonate tautomerase family)